MIFVSVLFYTNLFHNYKDSVLTDEFKHFEYTQDGELLYLRNAAYDNMNVILPENISLKQ